MRFFKHTILAVALTGAAGFLSSCGKEDTSTSSLVSQNTLVESYIKTAKLSDSVSKSEDLWFYRFKKSAGNVKIQEGDKVELYYVLSVVTAESGSIFLKPFATNIETVATAKGLINPYTKYEPITVVVGKSGLPKGFDLGIRTLYEGDGAQLLFPSTYAYGGSAIGAVLANSAIGVRVYIIKVDR